jgi:protein-tyrosine-phosphatase
MKSVLFVGVINQDQSVMAQWLFGQYCRHHGIPAHAESAGTWQRHAEMGNPSTEKTIQFMATRGLNINFHRSRWTGNISFRDYDLVACLFPEHFDEIRGLVARTGGNARVVLANYPCGFPGLGVRSLVDYAKTEFAIEGLIPQVLQELGLQ